MMTDRPKLLLHVCCAICAAYVLEQLAPISQLTLYFTNDNIMPFEEYQLRLTALQQLVKHYNQTNKTQIELIITEYKVAEFVELVKTYDLAQYPEKGLRCEYCFKLRLEKTASYAKLNKFDYFATTLTISPQKKSSTINQIGLDLAKQYEVNYLVSDFKKQGGFQASLAIAKQLSLYQQNSCGCIFSKR
jgi:predicted adenine nucleotide alpha hydrolase (AANH) superfamily ATPase